MMPTRLKRGKSGPKNSLPKWSEIITENNENFDSEVRYYLEMNNYDMAKAMEEYEQDMNFEKDMIKDNKIYIRQKQRQKLENSNWGCFCFWFL